MYKFELECFNSGLFSAISVIITEKISIKHTVKDMEKEFRTYRKGNEEGI